MKVPPGINGPFMVAGVGWSGTSHYSGARTLPCLSKLPGCKLDCPLCMRVKRFACYLPLFSLKAVKQPQIVIQGAKRTWTTFTAFKFGDIVSVNRGNLERDTPLITANTLGGATVDTEKFRRRGPQDITRYLLHLWQWRELSESYGELFIPSVHTLEIEAGTRSVADDKPREYDGD